VTKTLVPGLRWWIIGLVFLATLINFIDRLTISVLAPVITAQLGLSNLEFASITTSFLAAYTSVRDCPENSMIASARNEDSPYRYSFGHWLRALMLLLGD
jgi:hypothetical protein